MPLYDYRIAKKVLSEGEKDRILAIFLNTTDGTTDWDTATAHYGSKSAESMRVSLRNAYKKIEKAGGKRDSMDGKSPSAALTNKLPATGSKRKASSEASGEEVLETPVPKAKRGRPTKKEVPEVKAESEDEELL